MYKPIRQYSVGLFVAVVLTGIVFSWLSYSVQIKRHIQINGLRHLALTQVLENTLAHIYLPLLQSPSRLSAEERAQQRLQLHQAAENALAGTNVLREPKVLMAPPSRLLYRHYDDSIGGLREDFFVEALRQAGLQLQYLKSTRGTKTPDYLIEKEGENLAVEIGGRSKGREQFKGVKVDRKLVFAHSPSPKKEQLPLFLLGYLS